MDGRTPRFTDRHVDSFLDDTFSVDGVRKEKERLTAEKELANRLDFQILSLISFAYNSGPAEISLAAESIFIFEEFIYFIIYYFSIGTFLKSYGCLSF